MRLATQSAFLKREVEAKLASRIPAALSPIQRIPRLMSCGVAVIDELLGGGVPIGGITEFSGLECSGRTSLAFAVLAEGTTDGGCAYIDVDDTADPRCFAASGVGLNNLLWVRLTSRASTTRTVKAMPRTVLQTLAAKRCGSHDPYTERKGLDVVLRDMLKEKAEARSFKAQGTPGHRNRRLSLAEACPEQVQYEQFNARKADESDPIRRADYRAAEEARLRAQPVIEVRSNFSKAEKPWARLDQAIRAADQVLQSGGFRVVVLDLGSTPEEQVLRIPLATWFRFRRAAQESDAILLLLTQVPCARSSASCVLDCTAERGRVGEKVLGNLAYSAEVARQRLGYYLGKKAPGRTIGWEATPAWMRAGGR